MTERIKFRKEKKTFLGQNTYSFNASKVLTENKGLFGSFR